MPHEPLRIGAFEVIPLCDGWAPLPLADECPGRAVDWDGERQRHPWAFPPGDRRSWAWHVHAFLIRGSGPLVLVDAGIGDLGRPPYDVRSRIDEELRATGVDAGLIRHVIHTHLHADHAGGASLPGGEPRFPNAVHHVHPADWSFFEGKDDFDARSAMGRLEDLEMLRLDPADGEVIPGVSVVHSPGHTPGHRSILVRDGDATLLLTGDLLHVPPQIEHPGWPSNHDEDPAEACTQRARLLGDARAGSWHVGVSHFARPFGTVEGSGWIGAAA
jgi:glyoxylase-like metal-dependent hydrolase (beta-lactamase superfamily II)